VTTGKRSNVALHWGFDLSGTERVIKKMGTGTDQEKFEEAVGERETPIVTTPKTRKGGDTQTTHKPRRYLDG